MLGIAFAMGQAPAQTGAAAPGGSQALMQFVPLILMFGIFYFLLIRPQQKKAKEHKALLDAVKKGDQVITAGGLHGKIIVVEDAVVTVEIAAGTNVKISKSHITAVNP